MGRSFRAPRSSDADEWIKVQALYALGFRFVGAGRAGEAPLPARLAELPAFVRDNPRHPLRVAEPAPGLLPNSVAELLPSAARSAPSHSRATPHRRHVHLLADEASQTLADRFESEFNAAGHRVTRSAVQRYPVADGLPALLHGLPTTGGIAVVAVSLSSPNRAWVLSELRHAELYPTIVAGVSDPDEVAACPPSRAARVVCPGMPLPFQS